MKKDFDHRDSAIAALLEWNQQDRRRKGRASTPQYQKTMRYLRRTFGTPIRHAHMAALGGTFEVKGLADEGQKKRSSK